MFAIYHWLITPIKELITRRNLLFFLGSVLASAIGIIIYGTPRPQPRRFTGTLRNLLPQAETIPGWAVTYRPVAETAELQRATTEILNYDDAVYGIFTHGELRLSIYAAYWIPGRMPRRLIAGHTPDVCWVLAGWAPSEAKSIELKAGSEQRLDGEQETVVSWRGSNHETWNVKTGTRNPEPRTMNSGLMALLPMQHRVFKLGDQTEYVVFCHLVNGQIFFYNDGGRPPWYGFIVDLWARGLRQREEQFFIRISSNRQLEEFRDAAPVQYFLHQLSVELEKMRRSTGDERS